jgi:hypothetical protein
MKTNVYFGLVVAALAITLQASPATARPWGGGPHSGQPEKLWPENGFGSRTPVTLPRDRHPPAGKSMGIPVTKTPSSVLINAQPKYFRPR